MIFRLISRAALALMGAALLSISPAGAQMKTGSAMKNFDQVFGTRSGERIYAYRARYTASTIPGNILFPGEQGSISFELSNETEAPIQANGRVDVIRYGTRGIPGDIWLSEVTGLGVVQSLPVAIEIAVKGKQTLTVSPRLPATKGAYALIIEVPGRGRHFITSIVRTFKASSARLQYPKFSLDHLPDPVLTRLGVQSIREGVEWWLPDAPDAAERWKRLDGQMKKLAVANISVMLMVGASPVPGPLGSRARPHLTEDGFMQSTKEDMAWLPQHDLQYRQWVAQVCRRYGWPRGPLTAFNLWNEPWEGLSISGWGADMLRYREIYRAMAAGVMDARKDGAQVLLAAADSQTNTMDKFFGDGKTDFLPLIDAMTIHYQGMASPANIKMFRNRRGPNGRVKIWDTESWVANTDDRVAAVVAANRAAGYDRSMGIFGGNIAEGEGDKPTTAWSTAASVGAMQHFVGERSFRALLFPRGLPWVMVFNGLNNRADDGAVVICGDISEEFGPNNVPFRTVQSLDVTRAKNAARVALASTTDAKKREALQTIIDKAEVRRGTLTIPADAAYNLYDFYGNPVAATNGRIVVPLDHRGFFLRPSGAAGSMPKLLSALRHADIRGFEAVEMIPRDFIAPIEKRPVLRVKVTNVLNRPTRGKLSATATGLQFGAPKVLSLRAGEVRTIEWPVSGRSRADNVYPLQLRFDAGRDGMAMHDENLHVNVIARKSIKIDGDLNDWKGALPQTVRSKQSTLSLAQAAYFPFVNFDPQNQGGVANGYVAYDKNNFYFAAKVADSTPDKGTVRMATRDDDQYFYPPIAYEADADATLKSKLVRVEKIEAGDKAALQTPDGQGQVRAYRENLDINRSFAFDLHLDQTTQVALYLFPYEVQNDVGVRVIVTDKSGREIDNQRFSNLWSGTYAVYNLSGDVRIRVRSEGWWFTAKAGALFFDAPANTNIGFVRSDFDTSGHWVGKYGAQGYWMAGGEAKLPAGATIAMPEEVRAKAWRWPAEVRRFSYRKWPELPVGHFTPSYDNVQIAFNILPEAQKSTLAMLPGTMPDFVVTQDTDYEYALNKVDAKYGGGTEIWRLLVPGMPRKMFYPRQPKSPFDGAVKGGQLVVKHSGNTRIVEASIPWREIPHVRQAMEANRVVKFSFLVNDAGGPGAMELAKERSVSKASGYAFHVDWATHWSNQLEFGWGR